MIECEYLSCHREAAYKVAYTETSPHKHKYLCGEHTTTEQIHDPEGTKIVERPPLEDSA